LTCSDCQASTPSAMSGQAVKRMVLTVAGRVPRITDIQPIPLSVPLERPVRMALGELRSRNGMLVVVTTDVGLTGIGESWVNFPAWAASERVATITEGVRPLLLGQTVDDPRRLWRLCRDTLHRLALQWGAIGPMYQAISGVDIALWDLAGKIAGVPIWQLLGAPRQDTVCAYASGLGPEHVAAQATAAVGEGFGAVKLKVGFDRARDERNLDEARAAIGKTPLFTDANQGWAVDHARDMASALSAAHAEWIEEPLAVDDPNWDSVRTLFALPVAGGENLYGIDEFRRWRHARRLDVVQPDVCKCGGITAAHEILVQAGESGLRLAPHYFGGAVGLAATIHLFAALSAAQRMLVEYDINPNPLRESLLMEPLYVGGGNLRVPDGPGLGIELNAGIVERFGRL